MSNCTGLATVSSQADVDNLSLSCYAKIVIQGTMDTLNFTTLEGAGTITAHNSPWLEAMRFPRLSRLSTLIITNLTALTTVALPMFSTGLLEFAENFVLYGDNFFNLNISTAPNLTTLELENLASYGLLSLFNTTPTNRVSDLGTNNISAAFQVKTDACVRFHHLENVGDLKLFAVPSCDYSFNSLKSAGNITISNASSLFKYNFELDALSGYPPIRINNSLILESSAPPDPAVYLSGLISFDRISTIGDDLKISSMSNAHMDFGSITEVGGDLSLVGNSNCTWGFSQLTSAGSLTILDNENTTIPLFSQLQTVDNIHLRGNIDMSGGPNIFPTLVLAKGNVTVEAWNSNFNCSKLVSQWNDGVIHNLFCNGTGGTGISTLNPANTSTSDPSDNAHLSTGALAGIGVGSGLFVLLIIAIIIWLALHYRRQLQSLKREHTQTLFVDHLGHHQIPDYPDVGGLHEVDGRGIIREMSHDPVIPELSDSRPEFSTSSMRNSLSQGSDRTQHLG